MAFPSGGWWPQFSPDGARIAAGAVSITVADVVLQADLVTLLPNNQRELGTGQAPAWYTADSLAWYNRGDGTAARIKRSIAPFTTSTDLASLAATYFSAGGGAYIIAQNGQQRILLNGTQIASDGGQVWMDQNGRYVYTQQQNQALYLSSVGRLDFFTNGIVDPMVSPAAVVWSRLIPGGFRQTYGYRDAIGQIVNLGLGLTNEFYPRVVDTPVGPWILYHSDTQLLLHPWGNANLIVVQTGITNFPHMVYHQPTGAFRIAWSAAGQLTMRSVAVDILDPLYAIGSGTTVGTPGSGPPSGGTSDTLRSPVAKMEEAAKLAAARRARPVFPRVDEVKDEAAQTGLRILFDRIFQVEQQIQGSGGVTSQIQALQTTVNANEAAVDTKLAQLSVATEGTSAALGGAFPGGGSGSEPGGGGGGSGGGGGTSSDCTGAPATGHIAAGELTYTRFVQVICGTATEFAALRNPVQDLATRQANAETLILRMIWHLQQAGFNAGRQRNPSLTISKDKLACVILTETRAFDVFRDYDNFAITMQVGPNEVFPADLVASSGISD